MLELDDTIKKTMQNKFRFAITEKDGVKGTSCGGCNCNDLKNCYYGT